MESPSWEAEGLALHRLRMAPLVVRLHSPISEVAHHDRWAAAPDFAAAAGLERWLLASADGVTGSTAGVVRTAELQSGLALASDPRYRHIPLGVPPGPPAVPEPIGPPRLLFVGRLERRKGIHCLLAALPTLLDRHRDLAVDIVGDDTCASESGKPFRLEFERRHHRAPWFARCRFHGIVDDLTLRTFYRGCTVFVAPSLYESFGLIYVEAMRWGRAVIGCHVGGVPEVVHDGETGLLVPPDDPGALVAAIERLLSDPALRSRLGAAGRAAVETEFSARRMAERTVQFYAEVVARTARPPATAR